MLLEMDGVKEKDLGKYSFNNGIIFSAQVLFRIRFPKYWPCGIFTY